MTMRRTVSTGRALALAAAVALTSACGSPAPEPAAAAAVAVSTDTVVLTDEAIKNAGLSVETVRTTTRADRIEALGLMAVNDSRTARIGSLQEGLIVDTPAHVGDRVKARQLLARMHSHVLHDAWAGYRKALADLRRVERMLLFAADAHERAKRLYADKAVSQQDVQRAEVERSSATEMVAVAKAEVQRSIEELEHVGVSIHEDEPGQGPSGPEIADETEERIPVRSPIAGVVLERLVTPGSTVVTGTPLFVVSDLSTLWAIAEVDESHLSRVKVGRPVDVTVAAYPGEHFAGTITYIADTVNPKTRRITIRSTVANADGRLKPEMFATMALGEGDPRTVVVVPAAALQSVNGAISVFVAEAGGRFVVRPVQTGEDADGLVEITSGLKEGERVAVNGSFVLKAELGKEPEGGN
ncbi:MAG TPA: efflux RND transporter periplasmic adaptor subunit [Vicinamibacterales bacterium]|nr:efflux RND transporter periplasmic adaptor subunit [Vicinamibacterales bacterium]